MSIETQTRLAPSHSVLRSTMNQDKIILAGGSGFLGGELARHFCVLGWQVIILSRSPRTRTNGVREITWDAKSLGNWANEFEGATAVVNLTGRSVDCRYTKKNRREIMESRVDSTRVVGEAISRCKIPPRVWLNSSTATVYRHTFDKAHDESSREMDSATDAKDAFSVEVAQAWERALFEEMDGRILMASATKPATRRIALRTSLVLGLGRNSVFPVLRRLTKFGLGGRQGSGKQFVSWIHVVDFCRAVEWMIAHDELSGPVNQCAPEPLPNSAMMKLFREVCGVPIGLPATEWMLEIGAFFLRTETELIFKSRRVVPGRLLESGFQFHYPTFREALMDLENKAG